MLFELIYWIDNFDLLILKRKCQNSKMVGFYCMDLVSPSDPTLAELLHFSCQLPL